MTLVLRSFVILAVVSFGALGSGTDTNAQEFQSKLFGKWKPNVEKTKEALSKLEGDKAVPEQQLEMMLSMMGGMSLEFKEGGVMKVVMSFNGQEQNREGKFEIVKTDEKEKTLEMKVDMGQGASDENDTGKVKFLTDDRVQISPGRNEPPLVMDRVKKKDEDD